MTTQTNRGPTHLGLILSVLFPLLVFISPSSSFATSTLNTKVQFYSAELNFNYDPAMLKKNKHCTSTACIEKFHGKIEATDYTILLNDLLSYKEKYKLNDWFFYNLVRKTVEGIYPKQSSMYQTTVTWFFMTKAGYDTRLYTAQNKYTFLYVRTEDEVYEMPFVKVEGAFYLDLTSIYFKAKTKGLLMEMQKFQPGALNNRLFSLKIQEYPSLPPMIVEKEYQFKHNQKDIRLKVKIDTISNQLLSNYPFIKVMNYIKTPFTETTKKSFEKALKPHLKNLEVEDQLSFLVSFTRKAFDYKSDQMTIRRDQPLTAEEALVSATSDYEDRVSIMYQLLKETTELNFIVIQYIYDDIVTIGVELPEVFGNPFVYNGIHYTICDPTMPSNTGKLGLYPINLDKDFEILEEVIQQTEVGFKD